VYFCVFNRVLLRDALSCMHACIHSRSLLYACIHTLTLSLVCMHTYTHTRLTRTSFCEYPLCVYSMRVRAPTRSAEPLDKHIHMHALTHRRTSVRKRSVRECYVCVHVKRLGRTSGCACTHQYSGMCECMCRRYGYEDKLYIHVLILLYLPSYHYVCVVIPLHMWHEVRVR
jgi:hypothetical protein